MINKSYNAFDHVNCFFKSIHCNYKIKKLEQELDIIESQGLIFDGINIEATQNKQIDETLKKTEDLVNKLNSLGHSRFSKKHFQFLMKYQALKYRLRTSIEILELKESEQNEIKTKKEQLTHLIKSFKKDTFAIEDHKITENDKAIIDETIDKYTEFADLILNDKNSQIRKQFFEFVILFHNPVQIFIEYPQLAHRLLESSLAMRIGWYKSKGFENKVDLLKIETLNEEINGKKVKRKTVTLAFVKNSHKEKGEIFRTCILNQDNQVNFGKKEASVGEIFTQFQKKMDTNDTDFEIFEHGIEVYNIAKFADIDFKKETWYEELPAFKKLSKAEGKQRYGDLEKDQWGLKICGNKLGPGMGFVGTHAYIEIAIPNNEEDYQLYSFGKFSKQFPANNLEKLLIMGDTVPGQIVVDYSLFKLDRRITSKNFQIDSDQGKKLIEKIKGDIINGRDTDNFPFQFMHSNCADWVVSVMKEIGVGGIKDLFEIHVLDARPDDILFGTICNAGRFVKEELPEKMSQKIINVFSSVSLMTWRGMYIDELESSSSNDENKKKVRKWVSVSNSGYLENNKILHPFQLASNSHLG